MPARRLKRYDLSPTKAAALLGVHADTLREWADAGLVPCWVTPTGHRRFNRDDIAALLPPQAAAQ
jgi:excisionase family DNA binding protein